MVELMDKQMRERRIIRNLELLIGARELEMDYKLMTCTIKGEKKPSLHLGRNQVNTYAIRNTKLLSGIEDSHHEPSDAMHNPSQPLKNIRVMPKSIHRDDENPSRANIKQALWKMVTYRFTLSVLSALRRFGNENG
ncbi:hypothetical protein Tco_1412884 [Tanacetum coccineum]